MTEILHMDDTRVQRMEQAALWLQRMHAGADDERVVESWLDWCQRDPLNQQAFDELAAVWELSGNLSRPAPAVPIAAAGAARAGHGRRALAASLAALVVTAGAGLWWVKRPAGADVLTSEFASPAGMNMIRKLADGSVLELGADTRVTVSIGPRARRIQLHQGELYVTVHKDPSRPLSVDAGRLKAIATGTAFNVLRTEARTTVTVAEGSVDAIYEGQAAATPNMRLQPNQQLVYTHASHSVAVREADSQIAIAWRSGHPKFQGEPLSEVIATVNRYTALKFVIEDPRVGALTFTGNAHVDNRGRWREGLEKIFPVAVVRLSDGRQLIDPRPGAFPE
jgi:transmembrane sensor